MATVFTNLHDFCGTYFFWFPDFAQSPGFAGCLAVVAAGIAYVATTRNSRKEQWWNRAEYALNLTLSAEDTAQIAGLEMLDALESKTKPERAFIDAATHWFLSQEPPGAFVGSPGEEPPEDYVDTTPASRRERFLSTVRGFFRLPRA